MQPAGIDWWRALLEEAPARLELPRPPADGGGPSSVPRSVDDPTDAVTLVAGLLARYNVGGTAVLTVGREGSWFPLVVDLSDGPSRADAHARCSAAWADGRAHPVALPDIAAAVGTSVIQVAVHLDDTAWPVDTAATLRFVRSGDALDIATDAVATAPGQAVSLAGHLGALAAGWTGDRPLGDVDILSPGERAELLRTSAGPDHDLPDGTVWDFIAAQAVATPDARAVSDDRTAITYGELVERVQSVAARLAARGVGRGDLVGVCVQRSVAMVVGLLGILRSGAAYVPIDPSYPSDRVAMMVEDAQLTTVVTESALAARLPAAVSARVLVDGGDEPSATGPEPIAPKGDDRAYVIFTSGSTGRPKGVVIGHRALLNFVLTIAREPGVTAADRLLAVTTLSFDIAGLELLVPLTVGGCVVVADQSTVLDPTALADRLVRHDISVMQATPATWRMLIDSGWSGRPELKVLCGGEALPSGLAAELLGRCAELWNMYGPTETTIWSLATRLLPGEPLTIGRPIGNTRCYVTGRHQDLLPDGLPGELLIGGDGLAEGYLGRPDLTAERFVTRNISHPDERLYRTGDLVRRAPDGTVEFISRMDNQVKVRGFRIELGEIETVLDARADVGRSVAVVRPDARSGANQIVAYVVAAPGAAVEAAELRAFLGEHLPPYMVPNAVVVLDAFTLTLNGKIDRKALPEPQLDETRTLEAPATPLEHRLLSLWREVLGVEHLGVTDDVFELGTGSLTLARLYTRMAKELEVDLPVAAAFNAPTIRAVAALLDQSKARDTGGFRSLVPIRTRGSRPPLFLVHGGAGTVLLYEPLARGLGDDQPVYAFQAAGLYGRAPAQRSVRAMAELYLREMRSVQPSGPYRIGGYCYGALVAFEMARLLGDRGERTELLITFNGTSPSYIRRYRPLFDRDGAVNDEDGRPRRRVLRPKAKVQQIWRTRTSLVTAAVDTLKYARALVLNRVRWRLGAVRLHVAVLLRRPLTERLRESGGFQRLSAYAQARYDPPPLAGDMLVVRGEGLYHQSDLGWGVHVTGAVEVVEVPGASLTPRDAMKADHVAPIVAAVRTRLDALAMGDRRPTDG